MELKIITMKNPFSAKMSGRFSAPDSIVLLHDLLGKLKQGYAGALRHRAAYLEQLGARRAQGDLQEIVSEYEQALEQETAVFLAALSRLG